VLAGPPHVGPGLLEAAGPDLGEAAAQTDAVLAEHTALTKGNR
jgi:hypothetical protein